MQITLCLLLGTHSITMQVLPQIVLQERQSGMFTTHEVIKCSTTGGLTKGDVSKRTVRQPACDTVTCFIQAMLGYEPKPHTPSTQGRKRKRKNHDNRRFSACSEGKECNLSKAGQVQQVQLMDNECSLDEGTEVEELANACLPLLCSAQQRFCLGSILTLNSPA